MTRRGDRGSATSVRARLLTLSKERGEAYQRLLVRFGIERLLYRLSRSAHAGSFVLKGATLFALWMDLPHRPTKDLDLLGYGPPDPERLLAVFRDVARMKVDADGLTFSEASLTATRIRANQKYEGIRLLMEAKLGSARISLQVDVGFGDDTSTPPAPVEIPTLLADQPAPVLRAYSREAVIAEKFHAIVDLGLPNTRMKDYFDILVLSRHFAFERARLAESIAVTFARRGTPIPTDCPDGLHNDFGTDEAKGKQWRAFLRRAAVREPLELAEVVSSVGAFLLPVTLATEEDKALDRWEPGGPWSSLV